MESRLCHDEEYYQLPLLWKEECKKQLPDSLTITRKLLFNRKNRLVKDESLRKASIETIESYLKEGYAQEITREDIQNASTVWYFSHHPVVNSREP